MQLNLRIKEGGWGEGPQANIETVARLVTGAFEPALPSTGHIDLLLEQNAQPRALSKLDRDEFVIHLSGPSKYCLQLTYQFGHEFTHVMAGPLDWEPDRFAWLEECLADVGSLCALSSVARNWEGQHMRPGWDATPMNCQAYSANYLAEHGRSINDDVNFKQWLAANLSLFEQDHTLRELNTIVARNLLPVFERDPAAWRAIRWLHGFERPEGMTFPEFLKSWHDACPKESQSTVDAIAEILGVSYPAPRPRLRRQPTTAPQLLAAIRSAVSKPRPASRPTSPPATSPPKPRRPGSPTE